MRVSKKPETMEHNSPEPEVVIIPAIDRLEEFERDRLRMLNAIEGSSATRSPESQKLYEELLSEAFIDFLNKWGLTT